MGRYSLAATARSAAPPAAVFAVVADARGWQRWTMVGRSTLEREGEPPPDGVGAVRRFANGPVGSREEVTVYEPPTRFGYRLLSGLPIRDYESMVTLTPDGTGTTIDWRSSFDPKVPGTGPMFRALLRRFVTGFATGLAREAERRG